MAALAMSASAANEPAAADSVQRDGDDTLLITPRPAVRAELTAGLWLPRLDGSVRLNTGAGSSELTLDSDLHLDDLQPIANFELLLLKEDIGLHLSGFAFSTDISSTFGPLTPGSGPKRFGSLTLNDGDPFSADFDLNSAAAELQFRSLNLLDTMHRDDAGPQMSFVPTLAARWVEIQQNITSGNGRDHAEKEWLGFLAGVAFDLEWRPELLTPYISRVDFNLATAIGPALGSNGGFMWQVRAAVRIAVTPQFEVLFGYRLVELDVSDDEFEMQGGLQGLFVAGSVRF